MLRTADKRLFVGKQVSSDIFDPKYNLFMDPRGILSISTFGPWSGAFLSSTVSTSSTAWPATNRAIFVPIIVPYPVVAERIVVGCGPTAGSNFDVGIYDPAGNLLVSSGSTARVASSEVVVNITDTYLKAGKYYLAMAVNGTANMVMRSPAQLGFTKLLGVYTMETAFALPNPATFVTAASAPIPSFQVLLRAAFSQPSLLSPHIPPLVITPYSKDSMGPAIAANVTLASAGSVAPGANIVSYVPFRMNVHATVRKMSLLVGATNTGNGDVGIYTAAGARIVNSGSTALGTANTLQEFDIADTLLAPGTYFMAATLSNAAGTWFSIGSQDELALPAYPVLTETTGGFGLPATATMVLSTTAVPLMPPAMGVHFDTLV